MSAKEKMRADILRWKQLAESADKERIQYAGIVVALLSKFGGEITIAKENFDAVTHQMAVQSSMLADGSVKLRLLTKKP